MPEEEETKYQVRVTISSLGNESRSIKFGEMTDAEIQKLVQTVNTAFHTVRMSQSLQLVGSDGVVVFANLDNVAFVEVHIA